MGYRTVTLDLPENVYEYAQDEATTSERKIEEVLSETLSFVYRAATLQDEREELSRLKDYSNAQLWSVIYRKLPSKSSQRLHSLLSQQTESELKEEESYELDTLLKHVDQQMLLRSEALLLLKQRGEDIMTYLEMFP